MQKITGPQLIYLGLEKPLNKNFDKSNVCRICGGHMLGNPIPESSRSLNWTDENLCRRKDSSMICEACNWFTVNRNRIKYWDKASGFYATKSNFLPLTSPADLYYLLKEQTLHSSLNLETNTSDASLLVLRGDDANISRKHQQWRTIDGVTYDRRCTKITVVGIRAFKEPGKLFGVIEVDADEFMKYIEYLVLQTRTFLLPTFKYMTSDWQKRNQIYSDLRAATANIGSLSTILACYIVAHIAIPK